MNFEPGSEIIIQGHNGEKFRVLENLFFNHGVGIRYLKVENIITSEIINVVEDLCVEI